MADRLRWGILGAGNIAAQFAEGLSDSATGVLAAIGSRDLGRARAFASKVRDVTETLAQLGDRRAPRHALTLTVAYHDACHLAHAQGIRKEPRDLLADVPGISLLPVAESDICCGSAGVFNLVQPELAGELGRRKAGHLAATGADLVVTAVHDGREAGEAIARYLTAT